MQLFTNNAVALLASSIDSNDLSLQVQPGLGNLFPNPVALDDYFLVTLESIYAPLSREIVKISSRIGDVFTISERGVEDTVAADWDADLVLVDHRITAQTFTTLLGRRTLFDQPFSIGPGDMGKTLITLTLQYETGSVQLYVGGLRQKNTIDYIEKTPTQIELQYLLTESDIAEGQHVVIDCVAS